MKIFYLTLVLWLAVVLFHVVAGQWFNPGYPTVHLLGQRPLPIRGRHFAALSNGFNSAPSYYSENLQRTCRATTADTQGPYYKPNAPLIALEVNRPPPICDYVTEAYDRVFINGTISIQSSADDCGTPVRALVDVWQANAKGIYSNHNSLSPDFACRIQFYTSADGRYSLESIMPGRYICNECPVAEYRPAHIHFKITPVDASNSPIREPFITQLYFFQDRYLKPVDPCPNCNSNSASQIITVDHYNDIKTYEGTWNVLLALAEDIGPRSQRYY